MLRWRWLQGGNHKEGPFGWLNFSKVTTKWGAGNVIKTRVCEREAHDTL